MKLYDKMICPSCENDILNKQMMSMEFEFENIENVFYKVIEYRCDTCGCSFLDSEKKEL